MAVITTDILIKDFRRDVVFDWLGELSHHQAFLSKAFDQVNKISDTELELVFQAGIRRRTMGYHFIKKDNSHGGRRIQIKTTGKRTQGHLSYSLRTIKPGSHTLVTLHLDYNPGTLLGSVINSINLREFLQQNFTQAMENLLRDFIQSNQ